MSADGVPVSITRTADGFALSGPVTIATAAAIIELIRGAWPEEGVSTIDLAGVTDADSVAVALIFKWQRDAARKSRGVRVINVPSNVVALARLYGVDDLIAA